MNTGHTRESPRAEVADHVIAALAPLVGGALGLGERPPREGGGEAGAMRR